MLSSGGEEADIYGAGMPDPEINKWSCLPPNSVGDGFNFVQTYQRDTWYTTNFQGQRVKGQGHNVTWRISIKKC